MPQHGGDGQHGQDDARLLFRFLRAYGVLKNDNVVDQTDLLGQRHGSSGGNGKEKATATAGGAAAINAGVRAAAEPRQGRPGGGERSWRSSWLRIARSNGVTEASCIFMYVSSPAVTLHGRGLLPGLAHATGLPATRRGISSLNAWPIAPGACERRSERSLARRGGRHGHGFLWLPSWAGRALRRPKTAAAGEGQAVLHASGGQGLRAGLYREAGVQKCTGLLAFDKADAAKRRRLFDALTNLRDGDAVGTAGLWQGRSLKGLPRAERESFEGGHDTLYATCFYRDRDKVNAAYVMAAGCVSWNGCSYADERRQYVDCRGRMRPRMLVRRRAEAVRRLPGADETADARTQTSRGRT